MTGRDKSKEKAARIMAAAKAVLAREGYAGTTIAKVSAQAGVSRGLLHYYFQNKEQMLAKVLRTNMAGIVAALEELLSQSRSPARLCSGLTASLKDLFTHELSYPRLFIEGLAVAKHSELVRQAMEDLFSLYRKTLVQGVSRLTGWDSAKAEGRAGLIMAAMDGLAIQVLTMPGLARKPTTWQAFEQGLLVLLEATDRAGG